MYIYINLLTQNVLEDTDGMLQPALDGGSKHPISVLLGSQLCYHILLYTDVFANSLLILILVGIHRSPTTQDQLYAGSHIEGHGEAETPSSSTTWTEAGTGASTRQGSPVRRRSKSRQSNSNRDSNHRDSNRDSVGTWHPPVTS